MAYNIPDHDPLRTVERAPLMRVYDYKYTLQKKKRKTTSKKETQTTFKKRNAKPHIGDIGKIILIAVW